MNPFEMVVGIVLLVTIGSVFRARYGYRSRRRGEGEELTFVESQENAKLREEVRALKERLQVLERITVDKENSLTREIEQLRDR